MNKLNQYIGDENFTQAVLEYVPACIKVLNLDGIILYLNPKGVELLELNDPRSALGVNWLSYWKGNDKKLAKQAIQVAVAGGVGTFEGYYKTEGSSKKWWDVTVTALVDDNKPTQLLAISRDITDRHEGAQRLAAKNVELEALVFKLKVKQERLDAAKNMLDSLLTQSHSYDTGPKKKNRGNS